METPPFIWVAGKLDDWDKAQVHVLTHSLHYGMAAFEGTRAYKTPTGTAVFRLQEHVRRLLDSCHIMGMKVPYTREQISEACREVVRSNKMDECYLRPLVFMGDGAMGVYAPNNPIRVMIACWKWGAYLGEEGLKRGIRAKVSSFTRSHPNATMNKAKVTANYVNSMLAKREARQSGSDEAILLEPLGRVSEASGKNRLVVRDGMYTTPPLPTLL